MFLPFIFYILLLLFDLHAYSLKMLTFRSLFFANADLRAIFRSNYEIYKHVISIRHNCKIPKATNSFQISQTKI